MGKQVQMVVGVLFVIGAIYLMNRGCNATYRPKPAVEAGGQEISASSGDDRLPCKCAIVMTAEDSASITGIPGLNLDGTSLRLLRPLGAMLEDQLRVSAGEMFREVVVIERCAKAQDADVVIHVGEFAFNTKGDLQWRLRGLAMLAARVDTAIALEVEARVSDKTAGTYSLQKDGSTSSNRGIRLFPLPQLNKLMTLETEAAVHDACRQIFADIRRRHKS